MEAWQHATERFDISFLLQALSGCNCFWVPSHSISLSLALCGLLKGQTKVNCLTLNYENDRRQDAKDIYREHVLRECTRTRTRTHYQYFAFVCVCLDCKNVCPVLSCARLKHLEIPFAK